MAKVNIAEHLLSVIQTEGAVVIGVIFGQHLLEQQQGCIILVRHVLAWIDAVDVLGVAPLVDGQEIEAIVEPRDVL